MEQLLAWIRRIYQEQGPTGIVALGTTATTVVLLVVSFFRPDVFDQLKSIHAFEILVLTLLVTLVARTPRDARPPSGIELLPTDDAGVDRLRQILKSRHVTRADLLSAGLSSRHTLIEHLANQDIRVRVLVQEPTIAIDANDAQRLPSMVRTMYRATDAPKRSNIDLCAAMNTASLRATLLYDQGDEPVAGLLGWYVYVEKNTGIFGGSRPVILATDAGADGQALLRFAASEVRRHTLESRSYDPLGSGSAKAEAPSRGGETAGAK
jgi:hypothetical protein